MIPYANLTNIASTYFLIYTAKVNRRNQKTRILVNYSASIKKHCSAPVAYTHNLAATKEIPEKKNTKPVNKYVSRTHTCGELNIQNVGDNVHLCGWLEYQRMNKFATLRDSYGSTQLIIEDHRTDLKNLIHACKFESVLAVTGTVVERPKGLNNPKMKTGDIEVQIESIEILNTATSDLPLFIREFNEAKENLQLKYRYLALRYPKLQRNLRLRSQVIAKMRDYLIKECDFVDIETPTLFKSTPGGAQEFIVPTQHPGQFYSLVQSPQQFKQLLMVGGFDRYFQVARCYRDETGRPDRQPEFTQLDIEMSFVDREGIMELIENLLVYSWPEESEAIASPFKRLTYSQAMELYGTDKPDLRIPQKLHRLTEMINSTALEENLEMEWCKNYEIYALVFPNKHAYLTKSSKESISTHERDFPSVKLIYLKMEDKQKMKGNKIYSNIIKGHIEEQLGLNEGDVVFIALGKKLPTQSLLGRIRNEFANILERKGQTVRSLGNELVWITDFPLFSFDEAKNKLETMHHPFTQPHPDDLQYLSKDPLKVKGLHYDLVLNGSEIAGGSIRIHKTQLQKEILKILNIDDSQLTHLLNALEYGAPPHGGIALGLDRLICILCNAESIRSVIAFPKTSEGRDLMSGAPGPISEEEKILYHMTTTYGKEKVKNDSFHSTVSYVNSAEGPETVWR
ncbi:aspartyl-tRNA synthetase, mitochondrial [Calliopsis andreniformis]|uniref:aspartyl-tRNA synthetase, mitochondrial n=1 Tax=Calliopsis andreniformis TaxID=337506 RepID=UPI003FCD49E2